MLGATRCANHQWLDCMRRSKHADETLATAGPGMRERETSREDARAKKIARLGLDLVPPPSQPPEPAELFEFKSFGRSFHRHFLRAQKASVLWRKVERNPSSGSARKLVVLLLERASPAREPANELASQHASQQLVDSDWPASHHLSTSLLLLLRLLLSLHYETGSHIGRPVALARLEAGE